MTRRHRRPALAATLLTALASQGVFAQVLPIPGEIAQPITSMPSSALPDRTPTGAGSGEREFKPILLKPAAPSWLLAKLVAQNDMTGWTPLTDGATKGGAAVARLPGGKARIVVRGNDDGLYTTTIDAAQPGGAIDSATWQALGVTSASEPNCVGIASKPSIGCGWLGSTGNAMYGVLSAGPFGVSLATSDMGGTKASGRPAILKASVGDPIITPGTGGVSMLVLGNGTMFRRAKTTTKVQPSGGLLTPTLNAATSVTDDTGWTKMSGTFVTSAQCDAGRCAYVRTGGHLGVGDPFDELPGGSAQPLPGGWSAVAPVPVKLASGRYAVVARSANGRVYRSVATNGFQFSAWIDEGGTTMAAASLSCIADGEQPLCFAQGLDGRIYWKKLGTASGL